jgi:hypothetical protein
MMTTLAETISTALRAVGSATEDRLRDIMADFEALNLTEEERLAALASTVAATACTHHNRHRPIYLDAVRTWALEIAAELKPSPPRLRFPADVERIADGAELLTNGIDSLIEIMTSLSIRTQDRLVTELALVARFLGQNDANTILRALASVDRALSDRAFVPGTLVMVQLHDAQHLIARDANLELLEPRGRA